MRGEGRATAPSTESHTDLPRRARQKLYAKHISTGSYFRVVDRIKLIKTILEADANAANGAGLNLKELKAKKVRRESTERARSAASAGGFKCTDANLLVDARARAGHFGCLPAALLRGARASAAEMARVLDGAVAHAGR